jgi:starch-binding outer membrane protein, SusD/RagB family
MTTMMKIKKILVSIGLISVVLSSCNDYLDPYPNGERDEDDLWEYPTMVQGLIGKIYDYTPKSYDDNEGAYFECATDNGVSTSRTRDMTKWAQNSLTTGQDPFLTYWDRDYKAISLANTFLEDRKGFNTHYLTATNSDKDSLVRYRLQGEAFALRAWFLWDLLQKFGGKAKDGTMLGVPIVTEPLDLSKDVNLARNTYDECVQQILNDCDSAFKYLPIAHRDYLYTSAELAYAGSRYWNRIDGITTRAIKSNVYLTWASPRFNPGSDVNRWDSAAYYAKTVIDFKLTVDGVNNTENPQRANAFSPSSYINWQDPQSPEIVWSSQYYTGSNSMEKAFYPGGFGANGAMGATQELVDCFGMNNGYPIDDPRSGYDPQHPYLNRDPRFYSTIFYNSATANRLSNSEVMYTFETWTSEDGNTNGKDLADLTSTNCRTNYYIKKYIYMGWNPSDKSVDAQRRCKMLIRWEHMLLNFAEAANHVVASPAASLYGLSPKDAVKLLRERPTSDNNAGLFPSQADPYLDEVATNTDRFDVLVKNERRITTCFEGNRFYDLRRWTTSVDEMNMLTTREQDGYVHGVSIIKKADDSYLYDFSMQVEKRLFKSAYLPIPYEEILRMDNLIQNEGWDSWE